MRFLESKVFNSPYCGGLFILAGMLLYFSLSYIARGIWGPFDIEHVGATETLTYLFYGFGGGIIFSCAKDFMSDSSKIRTYSAIVFLYIVMIFRDMGAQAWFTTHDTVITKIRFFTSPNNPLYEKVIAGAIMLFILAVFLYAFIKHVKPYIKGMLKFEAIPWTFSIMFVWMVITQVADRLPAEFLKATGVAIVEPISFALKILEEGGESLLPLLIAVMFLQHRHLYCKKDEQ